MPKLDISGWLYPYKIPILSWIHLYIPINHIPVWINIFKDLQNLKKWIVFSDNHMFFSIMFHHVPYKKKVTFGEKNIWWNMFHMFSNLVSIWFVPCSRWYTTHFQTTTPAMKATTNRQGTVVSIPAIKPATWSVQIGFVAPPVMLVYKAH